MAKFCKSGGEACMVAIRIARAFAKKNNIAFCGYHGWHDWYLAANMKSSKNIIRISNDDIIFFGIKEIKNKFFKDKLSKNEFIYITKIVI